MSIDKLSRLRFAVAATRFGHGQVRLAARIRRDGVASFEKVLRTLPLERADDVAREADRLAAGGVDALLLGVEGYPDTLARIRSAPPALFVKGSRHLLAGPGIGLCGSRHASVQGLRAAQLCSEVAVRRGLAVVSGYARGVDMTAHIAALDRGDNTVIVLAEGIDRFRVRRGEFAEVWDPARAVVVSQFSPSQPWSAGTAMARNAVIGGLSDAVIVVEAGETGGTLAAGLQALERGQPVIVVQVPNAPAGSRLLLEKGATPIHSPLELESYLADLPRAETAQLRLTIG